MKCYRNQIKYQPQNIYFIHWRNINTNVVKNNDDPVLETINSKFNPAQFSCQLILPLVDQIYLIFLGIFFAY